MMTNYSTFLYLFNYDVITLCVLDYYSFYFECSNKIVVNIEKNRKDQD